MPLALDIIVLAVLIIAILLGYKNGLIKSLISLFGGIIALVLAFTLSTSLGNIVSEKVVLPPVHTFVSNTITEKVDINALESVARADAISVITTQLEKIDLKIFGMEDKKNEIIKNIQNAPNGESIRQSIDDSAISIATPIANSIGRVIAFILILIGVNIAFFILNLIFGFVGKLPILKQFNKLGGIIVGIVHGVLLVFIILSVLRFAMPFLEKNYNGDISQQTINKTVVTKTFYSINPIKF